ncbi:MAG TPA: radical SAM protein [bacterium]|nr:radical SAM protein [bacterium]
MIGISKLLIDKEEPSDELRYGKAGHPGETPAASNRPIVVYNCLRRCNLRCIHCYAQATNEEAPDILSTAEAKAMIDSAADFGCPVMLFSGGEPLMRGDVFELMRHAAARNMRTTLSTNGTLITRELAGELKTCRMGYVGISLDGLEDTHDKFRRHKGCFQEALSGLENCKAEGLRTGLRITLTRHNYRDVPAILDLLVEREIQRACFYHLVYTGRGSEMIEEDLTHDETRETMDIIIAKTLEIHARGLAKEVLTVDNHADGPYLWLWTKKHRPELADRVFKMISINRAQSTGQGISCVSWNGDVSPDQFWRDKILGNVRKNTFEQIWMNPDNQFLKDLRRREELVKGKCGRCRFLAICRGGFRARAEAKFGDMWAEDPACYLTWEETER